MAIKPQKFSNNPIRIVNRDQSKVSQAPVDVNQLHLRSDVDSGINAQHHTLGTNRNQASPGNHIHDGTTSKKLGAGLGITITGSRGGNAAVASIIAALSQIMDITDSTTA